MNGNGLFRELDEDEIKEFKQWARDNYKSGDGISSLWHPVIKKECVLIDDETRDYK